MPLNGCLPTISLNVSRSCLERASINLEAVLSDKNIKAVILATTWYAESYINSDGNEVDRKALRGSISELVSEIAGRGKLPILFSPIAIPEKDYASELARQLRFGGISEKDALEKMKVPRSSYEEEFEDTNAHFEMLMGDAFVKIFDDLCDPNNCMFGNEDLFYFADGTHLSSDALSSFDKSKAQLHSVLSSLE